MSDCHESLTNGGHANLWGEATYGALKRAKTRLMSGFVGCTIRHNTLIARNFQTVVGVVVDDDDGGGGSGGDYVTQGSMDLILTVPLWLSALCEIVLIRFAIFCQPKCHLNFFIQT